MTQPYMQQQIKSKIAVVIFLKGTSTPVLLFVDNPNELYEELLSYLRMPTISKLVEKETQGPIKKIAFYSNQILSVALQDIQYLQQ